MTAESLASEKEGPANEENLDLLIDKQLGLTKNKKNAMILLIVLLQLSSGLLISLMAPFYPEIARSRNVTTTENGIVFAGLGVAGAIFAIPSGRMIYRIGPKTSTLLGLALTVSCSISFGLLIFEDSHDRFFGISCILRLLEGFGQTVLQAGAVTVITTIFQTSSGVVVSWTESAYALGMVIGPAIGGVVYDLAGFLGTFVSTGLAASLLIPSGLFLVPKDKDLKAIANKSNANCWDIFKIPEIWFASFHGLVGLLNLGFIRANLGLVLVEYHLNGKLKGQIFFLYGLVYTLSSLSWGKLCEKWLNPITAIVLANASFIISYFLLGPAPFLPLYKSLGLILVGVVFAGIGMGGSVTLSFIYSTHVCIRNKHPLNVETNSLLSAVFLEYSSIGNVAGGLIGGALYELIGFPNTVLVFSCFNGLVLILSVFLVCPEYNKDS